MNISCLILKFLSIDENNGALLSSNMKRKLKYRNKNKPTGISGEDARRASSEREKKMKKKERKALAKK